MHYFSTRRSPGSPNQIKEPAMTTNETKATEVQPTTDDVEGHRIAPFIEDYKDDASGLRRSVEDVEGHLRAPVPRR